MSLQLLCGGYVTLLCNWYILLLPFFVTAPMPQHVRGHSGTQMPAAIETQRP